MIPHNCKRKYQVIFFKIWKSTPWSPQSIQAPWNWNLAWTTHSSLGFSALSSLLQHSIRIPRSIVNAHYIWITRTHKNLENRKINMFPSELLAFLWGENGKNYNDKDILSELFHEFYLEWVSIPVFCASQLLQLTLFLPGCLTCLYWPIYSSWWRFIQGMFMQCSPPQHG